MKAYPGRVPSLHRVIRTHQNQHRSTHRTTTTSTQTVLAMSQYNAAPYSAADKAGWGATDAELAPFLPTMDQSEGSDTPAGAGAGRSAVALPPNTGLLSLHAKAESTG